MFLFLNENLYSKEKAILTNHLARSVDVLFLPRESCDHYSVVHGLSYY